MRLINIKKTGLWLLSLVLTLSIIGCSQPTLAEVVQSSKERSTSPDVSPTSLAKLTEGNNAFAFDLYHALRSDEAGNLFYSPHSISTALAMTYAGARGLTAEQMAETLHFYLSQPELHPSFNKLDMELAKRGEGAKGSDGEGFRLHIINAIWGQEGYPFLDTFLDTLAENYGAGLRILDYVNKPEEARKIINDWVSQQTEERIEELIPQGVIDAATRLVLTNAIYFNAAWQFPFDEKLTTEGLFTLLDGSQIGVPVMTQQQQFKYAEGDGFQAVELPYDGKELSMLILLPQEGLFKDFEKQLSADLVDDIMDTLSSQPVALSMPKFEYESDFSLKDTLADMGMPIAFTGGADFSGMTGSGDLFIAEVLHKAFVSVNEAGTEAAAATAVIMQESAAPGSPIEFNMDRPFIYLIRDNATGACLFLGSLVSPQA
jgi:serpin B